MIGTLLCIVNSYLRYFWHFELEFNANKDYSYNDLNQIALNEIDKKQRDINKEKIKTFQFDDLIYEAQGPGEIIRTQGLSNSSTIRKTNVLIQFDENKPKLASECGFFNGKIDNKYEITVKRSKSKREFNHELTYNEKLKNCNHFLSLLFPVVDNVTFVLEFFSCTLRQYDGEFKLYDVVKQLTNGLKYLHNLKIAHLQFDADNIAVVAHPTLTFKIMNFSKAETTNSTKLFEKDTYDLGETIEYVYYCKNFKVKYSTYESYSLFHLIEICMNNRPSITELTKHPYFYSTKDTLNFIVKVCRTMENSRPLRQIINKSRKGFGVNWVEILRQDTSGDELYIALNVLAKTIKKFKYLNFKSENVELIRRIRNLVSSNSITLNRSTINCFFGYILKIVHERPVEVHHALKIANETDFLNFWTQRFPLLIIELYEALKLCSNK